jgi:RimJ/RimL family protein N-acetyltransferase
MAPEYVFRPMSTGDLPLIRQWLEMPAVARYEPDMIGRGHGSGFIRQFVDALLGQGIPRVVTDPDPDNIRAVRAYARVGFHSERLVDTPDRPALLMVRDT